MTRINRNCCATRVAAATLAALIIFGPEISGPLAADQSLTVTLTGLQCNEETNEVGSDRPWLVTYAINFRSRDFQFGFARFVDVDQGELHRKSWDDRFRIQEDVVIAGWGNVEHAEDILIMILLAEDDFTGINGDNFTSSILVPDWLRKASVPMMEYRIESFRNHEISRQQIADEVRRDLARGYLGPKTRHGDDLIGIVPLNIDPRILAADSPQSVKTWVNVAGDGGRFSIRFRIETGNRKSAGNRTGNRRPGSSLAGNTLTASGTGPVVIENMLQADLSDHLTGNDPTRPGGTFDPQGAAGIPGQATVPASGDLNGTWTGVAGVRYQFRQQQNRFTWVAPAIGEQGSGTIEGMSIEASWNGNLGPGSATGRLFHDSGGRVNRIEWDNGVSFLR